MAFSFSISIETDHIEGQSDTCFCFSPVSKATQTKCVLSKLWLWAQYCWVECSSWLHNGNQEPWFYMVHVNDMNHITIFMTYFERFRVHNSLIFFFVWHHHNELISNGFSLLSGPSYHTFIHLITTHFPLELLPALWGLWFIGIHTRSAILPNELNYLLFFSSVAQSAAHSPQHNVLLHGLMWITWVPQRTREQC